ncbi:Glycoside hydrolase, 38 vacuolar alpha mannosidase [Ascosphaera atra]|nr:Glycoside hydrolase, 38 vacuolar alpha mannosidase [Ascosphaera atra]
MRLSLLRSPKAPDDTADMGRHTIRYAIFPHTGPLDSRTVRAGYNFNNPLVLRPMPVKSFDEATQELLQGVKLSGDPALVLDWIKRGEDDHDVSTDEKTKRHGKSVIIRVFDSLGGRSRGEIKTALGVKKVFKTNALEDDEEEIPLLDDHRFFIELRPFEVATYRLQL